MYFFPWLVSSWVNLNDWGIKALNLSFLLSRMSFPAFLVLFWLFNNIFCIIKSEFWQGPKCLLQYGECKSCLWQSLKVHSNSFCRAHIVLILSKISIHTNEDIQTLSWNCIFSLNYYVKKIQLNIVCTVTCCSEIKALSVHVLFCLTLVRLVRRV